MKITCLKNFSGMALAAMLTLTIMLTPTFAQDTMDAKSAQEESHGRSTQASKIEGVWDVTATFVDCNTGQETGTARRSMNMFIQGGALYGTIPAQAQPRDPSLGTWRHLRGRRYRAVMTFFLFNPDGSIAGTRKIMREIELSMDENEFTATATFENFDLEGNPVPGSAGCGTERATRKL
jgi:hypothetical protein